MSDTEGQETQQTKLSLMTENQSSARNNLWSAHQSSMFSISHSPGEGNGHPLHYSYLGNPVDRGAWQPTVHAVRKSQIQLSD